MNVDFHGVSKVEVRHTRFAKPSMGDSFNYIYLTIYDEKGKEQGEVRIYSYKMDLGLELA